MLLRFLKDLKSSNVRSQRELRHYVIRISALCVLAALLCDVVSQLTFFVSWPVAFRSWGCSVVVALAVSIPAARALGMANLRFFQASQTDYLTGLLNRRALYESVSRHPSLTALMIADVDRFKAVNDTYGHMVGDDVLRHVAALLKQYLGPFGCVGRLGGEEFGLVTTRTDHAAVLEALERFREAVEATPVTSKSTSVSITISAGVALGSGRERLEDLYAAADAALYDAKRNGRNRIVCADPPDAHTAPRPSLTLVPAEVA